MAFDERLAARVRTLLSDRSDVTERRMFGGRTFMVRGHTCCGVNKDELIVRLAADEEEAALRSPHARPMDFTNRPMSGFVTIGPAGLGGPELGRLVAAAVTHAESLPRKPRARRPDR